jgi:hypothetical protein
LQEQAVQKAKEAGDSTQEFVKENSWKSLCIAACAGLLLGAMFKGSTSSDTTDDGAQSEPPKLSKS